MRKTCWLLLLFLVPVQAEEPEPKAAQKPKPIFLWEAKHETGTAYLLGTIHIPDPRVLKLPRVTEEAFQRSDVVLTEIQLDGATQAKVMKLMLLPKGETLSNTLPDDVRERLSALIPVQALDQYKVWGATMTVMVLQAREYFLSGRQPLDSELPARGKATGKEIGALETAEEQIGIFNELSTEDQIQMLSDTLDLIEKDKREGKNSIKAMLDLYLEGDLEKIVKFEVLNGKEPTERDKKFMKMILDDRNVHMADRLAAKMKKEPGKVWFVAVGAAHHYGDIGVPALLKKKGFKVRRMTREDTVKPRPKAEKPPKVTEPAKEPLGAK